VVAAARTTAAVFRLADRAVLEVHGADRVAFLQGQLTNDVTALASDAARASCQALALTREGRIVAELRVIARRESFWLETDASTCVAARERLEKYVVADDVTITDVSDAFARFAVEGPRAVALLAEASGVPLEIASDAVADATIGGVAVVAAGWSVLGGAGVQIFAPRPRAEDVAARLRAAAGTLGAVAGDAASLETLRIEAGVPRAGAEIGPDTLPAELHLVERAVSFTKGCFTGQEVVTRMHSRGRVGHVLVGLRLSGSGSVAPGSTLSRDGARAGVVTSVALSPTCGPIALAIVRKGCDEPGIELQANDTPVRVAPLPFVAPTALA
jgi:folate-binding protein YgfZ